MGRDSRDLKQTVIGAERLGLSAVTLAAERTSSTLNVEGFSQLTVFVVLSTRSAATTLQCAVDIQVPDGVGSTWVPIQTTATSGAVMTNIDGYWTMAVSAADVLLVNTPINYQHIRLRIDGDNGAAGDIASAYVILSQV